MAELFTADEILALWNEQKTQKQLDEEAEVDCLRKDLASANAVLSDAIDRYRKKKLKAKSKASAKAEDPFKELASYQTREDIRTEYGWELITENEMERLMNLWDLREEMKGKHPGPYTDRVIEMLERARIHLLEPEQEEKLIAYDKRYRDKKKLAQKIAGANAHRADEWEKTMNPAIKDLR